MAQSDDPSLRQITKGVVVIEALDLLRKRLIHVQASTVSNILGTIFKA